MFEMKIDQEVLKAMYMELCKESIKKFEEQTFFMDMKQLMKYLNLSRNSIVDHLMYLEDFPKIRIGTKWLFHKKRLDDFMNNYYLSVRNNGGDIQSYNKSEMKRAS